MNDTTKTASEASSSEHWIKLRREFDQIYDINARNDPDKFNVFNYCSALEFMLLRKFNELNIPRSTNTDYKVSFHYNCDNWIYVLDLKNWQKYVKVVCPHIQENPKEFPVFFMQIYDDVNNRILTHVFFYPLKHHYYPDLKEKITE